MLRTIFLFVAVLVSAGTLAAQQPTFRWVDFRSPDEQSTIDWVRRSLAAQKWTAIREIGVLYDAALVLTTDRTSPQGMPEADSFTIWSVSLTDRQVYVLLHGVNPRLAGWFNFSGSPADPLDLGLFYDNSRDVAAESYFTAFHYDLGQRMWLGRWMRGELAVPVWSAKAPDGVALAQIYGMMAEASGRNFLVTWKHFDYGKQKDPEDYLYRYDLDPDQQVERTMLVYGREAEAMKLRLCQGEEVLPGLARGQDASLCRELVKPKFERKPVTTPPANNRGLSAPPGSDGQPKASSKGKK